MSRFSKKPKHFPNTNKHHTPKFNTDSKNLEEIKDVSQKLNTLEKDLKQEKKEIQKEKKILKSGNYKFRHTEHKSHTYTRPREKFSREERTEEPQELRNQYDSRKSFYGKASTRNEGGKVVLKSYSTDVAYIEDGKPHVNGTYSPTNLRHIKEFLKQHVFKAENSKQIMRDYG